MTADGWRKVEIENWRPPLEFLERRVRLESCPDLADEFRELVAEAACVARPRAAWSAVPVQSVPSAQADREGGQVRCGGVEFRSPMLAHNLSNTGTAFPYIATCGDEIDKRFPSLDDPLAEYWLDEIKSAALYAAYDLLREEIRSTGGTGQLNSMNPGSGNAMLWPLSQQVPLFRILGEDASNWAGVKLGDSLLMKPNKSVSGLFFFGADGFVSCAYCERDGCPNRRAPCGMTEL